MRRAARIGPAGVAGNGIITAGGAVESVAVFSFGVFGVLPSLPTADAEFGGGSDGVVVVVVVVVVAIDRDCRATLLLLLLVGAGTSKSVAVDASRNSTGN